jgi:hypothetical protein
MLPMGLRFDVDFVNFLQHQPSYVLPNLEKLTYMLTVVLSKRHFAILVL